MTKLIALKGQKHLVISRLKNKAMTKYYWNILSRTTRFAIGRAEKTNIRTRKLQHDYYLSIANRINGEREEDLKKREVEYDTSRKR